MSWFYHNPKFDFDQCNPLVRKSSAWIGHVNFAYDLVRFMKPKIIVELGTHYGASFFSLCQAAKDGKIPTQCFAIDTWKGDSHSGFYGEDVFHTVKEICNRYYPNIANLIRSTFDEALDKLENATIDILHIDGYHTYEAVSHDFNSWMPKLSKNGVILFHDITVKIGDYEVYKFWEILKKKYPSFEFEHSHGLGVLFPKGYSQEFTEVFNKNKQLKDKYSDKNTEND